MKLKCAICGLILIGPMQPNCANNCDVLICSKHTSNYPTCLTCHGPANWKIDRTAQSLLDYIPITCSCGLSVAASEYQMHLLYCETAERKCGGCNFRGQRDDLLQHLYKEHYAEILHNFKNCTE